MAKGKTKKKPALPFDDLAAALLIERHNPVKAMWKAEGFNTTFPLSGQILTSGINGKATLALRRVLRQAEKHPGLENSYLLRLEEAKKLRKKEIESGFSIDIKGCGTKKEIIDSLEYIISSIKSSEVQALIEGVEVECDDVVLKTGTYESYAGYQIEEEGKNND